jgi:hypothetical protein
MTDEPDDPDGELGEIENVEPTDSEYYEVEGGFIIFPHGAQWYAETYDASAIRVTMAKGGEIEVQDVLTGKWRKPSQSNARSDVRVIRSEK